MSYRIEVLFTTKMRQQEWVRFGGPYETLEAAQVAAAQSHKRTGHKVRVAGPGLQDDGK